MGTPHAFSLASKLACLDVDEEIFLPDPGFDALQLGPTSLERQVQDRIAKSKKLVGRKFYISRADIITAGREHVRALRVRRTQ